MHSFDDGRYEQRGATEPLGRSDATRASGHAAGARGGTPLDAELRDTVRGVLLHAVCEVRFAEVADGDRRQLVQRMCGEAKVRGLPAERLIVLLKNAWCRLPEARRLPHPDADDVLARVITACIEEYYGHSARRRQD